MNSDSDSDDDYRPPSQENSPGGSQNDDSESLKTIIPIRSRNPLLPPTSSSSRKRQRQESSASNALLVHPSLKRRQGNFSVTYLNLLNRDIEDASAGQILIEDDDDDESTTHAAPLQPTQVGAVSWSADEKEALFSAVGRLGSDDLAGIAARIGSKSDLEIRQYLLLLESAERERRADEGKRRRTLRPVDFPAAVEIGAECGAALERIADAVSLRQESYEEGLEKKRWGTRWLIGSPLAQILELKFQKQPHQQQEEDHGEDRSEEALLHSQSEPQTQAQGQRGPEHHRPQQQSGQQQNQSRETIASQGKSIDDLPFLQLFHIRNWIRLSEEVFMNSSIPDGNWRNISTGSGEQPAIRATALEDFHALALSVTRRLVSAAIYVADSRIRAKNLGDPRRHTRRLVRPKDVKAAISSLGMKEDSRKFWAWSARRLRLDVVKDDDDDEEEEEATRSGNASELKMETEAETEEEGLHEFLRHEEDYDPYEYETMTYDEVELALEFPASRTQTGEGAGQADADLPSLSDSSSSASDDEEDQKIPADQDEDTEMQDRRSSSGEEDSNEDKDEHDENDEEDAPDEEHPNLDTAAIAQDLREALVYGPTLDHAGTTRARDALRLRIRTEHVLELLAERHDALASAEAESKLWAIIRGEDRTNKGKNNVPLPRTGDEVEDERRVAVAGRNVVTPTDDGDDEHDENNSDVDDGNTKAKARVRQSGLVDHAPNWREKFKYASEWETAPKN